MEEGGAIQDATLSAFMAGQRQTTPASFFSLGKPVALHFQPQ
jgi:hypothetical protein